MKLRIWTVLLIFGFAQFGGDKRAGTQSWSAKKQPYLNLPQTATQSSEPRPNKKPWYALRFGSCNSSFILCEFSLCRTGSTSTRPEYFASKCQPDIPVPCSRTCPAEACSPTATDMSPMTPSDTGWRMNSDTWLPTAPPRVTQTKPPVNTESGLRMHANQPHIEAAQTEHSGRTGLVRPHHLNNDFIPSSATDWRGYSASP